ncbi:hypothetical protein VDF76_08380 [Xanthomonas campestris pv. raphani]|uniref:hypothetical protein n=1 Tax=Xanthomonas campestris TaxID=339 RepID=UPI002B238882|nr:hypothetical protein [Xanthomonas campestris]MEA9747044.1 hypothetical protein [Xanthomonas campestris pv. raphani]MEA9847324.1 hypothetical protein [Xanthomonas campestris pv. raphani]MEA9928962.1 hypothetical protein [Xanthomonas campestris pv. raphani]
MARSSLFGRRIHITGSIAADASVATTEEVARAREVLEVLVKDLLRKGASFVVPVDAEKTRSDGLPVCFDWLIWDTIQKNLHTRPEGAPNPLVVAVKHHKNEDQIPDQFAGVWGALRGSALVQIESAAHWNMNSKRMEAQARHGDILIALGGGEGVLFLANLYHDAGKPVIPLNLKLGPPNTGAIRLFEYGLTGSNAQRLFQTEGGTSAHSWLNRIEIPARKGVADGVRDLLDLLEALVPPKAFVVRLLNPTHADYNDVQEFFDTVVQPVMEGELGYKLTVVDGNQAYDHARIDQEIFTKLHRSRVVLADITGLRPNCFLELGYALGRGLPTMVLAKAGTEHPFDIYSLSGHHWKTTGNAEDRRREFRTHWNAIKSRPPLVPTEPLIP